MPKLPSGLHVGITNSPMIDAIKVGDFKLKFGMLMSLRCVDDVKYLMSIIYYRGTDADGMPTDPYQSSFSLYDVEQRKLDWSDEDYLAFTNWQELPQVKAHLKKSYEEIQTAISQMKVVLPENLHGLFEG